MRSNVAQGYECSTEEMVRKDLEEADMKINNEKFLHLKKRDAPEPKEDRPCDSGKKNKKARFFLRT